VIVVFDWDGTLVDSAGAIVCAMQQAARDVGLPPPTDDAVRFIIGLGLPEAVRHLYPQGDAAQWHALGQAYSRCYVEQTEQLPPLFPGALAALERLRADGFAVAVATGKSRRGLNRELAVRDMGHLFDLSRCADETRSKPHPLMLQEILADSGRHPREAVMVGDTLHDLQMAREAGVMEVAVSFGAHCRERLLDFGPDLLADDFCTILEWVYRIRADGCGRLQAR